MVTFTKIDKNKKSYTSNDGTEYILRKRFDGKRGWILIYGEKEYEVRTIRGAIEIIQCIINQKKQAVAECNSSIK
jgi:hypothetical protein